MRVSQLGLEVDQPKINSAQISEQKILMLFFLIICLIGINWLKKNHRKKLAHMLDYSISCSCS